MRTTRMSLVCFVCGASLLATAEAQTGLIGGWNLDETAGTVAGDSGRLYIDDICVTKP